MFKKTFISPLLSFLLISFCIGAHCTNTEEMSKQYQKALEHYDNEDYDKCLKIINKEINNFTDTAYSALYETTLILKSRCHYRLADNEKAISTTRKYIYYHAKHVGTDDINYGCYLDNLSLYLVSTNSAEALEKNKEAEAIISKLAPYSHDLAVVYMHAADIYRDLDDYDNAINRMEKVLNIHKYNHGVHSEPYLDELTFLHKLYKEQDNEVKYMQLTGELAKLRKEAEQGYVPDSLEINDSIEARERIEDMRMCCKYYITHPLNDKDMANAAGFIMQWAVISDDVSIVIPPITNENLFYIIAYIAGYSTDALNNRSKKDEHSNFLQGYATMLNFYIKNKHILGENKEYEEYINLYDKNQQEFVDKVNAKYEELISNKDNEQ